MNTFSMNGILKSALLGLSVPMLLCADLSSEAPLGIGFLGEAEAVVGRPVTPVSYAGVARRTTRRAVAVGTTTAVAATAAAPTTVVVTAPPPAPAPAPAPAGAPPLGSMVTTLPDGCQTQAISGVEYYNCGGVYYRAAFQGNNLVYVVSQP